MPDLDINCWYLDDGVQVGDINQLGEVIRIIDAEGMEGGFELSKPKCVIWSPSLEEAEVGTDLLCLRGSSSSRGKYIP